MALTEQRHQARERDLPQADVIPAIERPGVAVARESTQHGPGKDRVAPSLFTRMRQHPFIVAAAVVAALLIVAAVVIWWLNARNYVSSADAFIDTHAVQITPQVGGTILAVPV